MAMQQNGHASKVQARAVDYFYGRISRDEAESFLMTKGCQDGLYLLRESINVAGNYALSICYKGRIHHYSIELQPNGTVMIPEGRPFPGPIELINHHSKYLDGFLVKPKIPCSRPKNTAPMAWPGVTMLELEEMLLAEAQNQRLDHVGLKNVFGPQRQKFMQLVAAKLHEEQPWYHGPIRRETAENNIATSRHIDGKFLVRQRDDKVVSFALSLSYHGTTKHYKIDKKRLADGESKLAIEDGPPFDNLMDMIAHYHNKMDGLLCKLTVFCCRPNYRKKQFCNDPSGVISNPIYGGRVEMTGVNIEGWTMLDPKEGDDDDTKPTLQITPPDKKVYDSVPRTDDVFNLKFNDLVLHSELGSGNFGSVQLGNYKHKGQTIPVAVKTLKTSDIEAEKDLLDEAKLMAQLDNQYIVRMIGVCKSDKIMLVLELAALGPLNKFLKKSPKMSMKDIQNLMFQVAQGMAYLESKLYVHRDLAARNVLLANVNHVKISDFGLSRAIGIGCNYYKANETGRWPLKWYAPECLYFFKFDSKSDVWSYGVTMWEATSYGNKPYKGMRGQAIIEMLDNDQRLEKPIDCPDHLYALMHKCWQRKSEERPTFQEIVGMFRNFTS